MLVSVTGTLTSMSVPIRRLLSSCPIGSQIIDVKDGHCSSHQHENINSTTILAALQKHVFCSLALLWSAEDQQLLIKINQLNTD